MNDQKQIEEMAKEKYKYFDEEVCSKLNCKKDCKYYGKSNCYRCIHKNICQLRAFSYCEEEVKEKGCEYYKQEIPQNAVVLTEKKDIQQYEWSKMLDKMGFFKFVDNLRKEMAEKFAERLKQVGELHYSFGEQRYDIATDDIDEIAKKITEGEK